MVNDASKTKAELIEELERLRRIIKKGPFKSLFDSVPLPYQSLDEDGCLVAANQAWLDLLGYDLDDVLGRPFSDFLIPEHASLFKERFPCFLEVGETSNVDFTMIHRDGTRILTSIDGKVGYDGSGQVLKTHCIVNDVTKKLQAEADIRDSESRFRGLFESSIDGIIYSDRQGTLLSANQAFCDMLGTTPDHLLGKNVRDITPETWQEAELAVLREEVLTNGHCDEFRKEFQHWDGHAVPVSVRIWIDGRESERAGVWGVVRDLTAEEFAKRSVAASEERYRLLAENSEDVIWTVDNEFNYTFISPSVEQLRGYTVEEAMRGNLSDAMASPSFGLVKQEYERVLKSEADGEAHCVSRTEVQLKRKDGSTVWAEVVARPMRDDSGKRIGFIGVTRNVEERKQAEIRLREQERTLKALLNATIDSVGMIGLDGTILAMNQNMADAMNLVAEDMIGKNLMDYTPAEVLAGRKLKFEEAVERREIVEGRDIRSGRIIDSTYYPVLDDGGSVISIAIYARDVTESILNEEARKQSEMQYRRIVETANEGIVGLDAQSNITYANKNTAKFFGYSTEELATMSFQQVLLPDDADAHEENMAQRADSERFRYEQQFVRKDGSLVWGLVSSTPMLAQDGAFLGSFAMITDITERKQAEASLRMTQYSVDNAPIDIYWLDDQGRLVYVNEHVCTSHGYTRDELLQLTLFDINSDVSRDGWQEYWEEGRRLKVRQFEAVHQRKDGSEFPLAITKLYQNYSGRELLFVFAYDLIERNEQNEMLRRSQDLLNEVQRISLTGGWELDMETRQVQWTEGLYRLHGVSPDIAPDELVRVFERHIHPDDRNSMNKVWKIMLRDKIPVESEYRIIKDDQSLATFLSVAIPEVDASGKVKRIYGSARDVTLEREAARELEQSHERLLSILDGIDAKVYVSDLDTHEILFMNAHMRTLYGEPADGAHCHEMLCDELNRCPDCKKPKLLDAQGNPLGAVVHESFSPKTGRWYLNHNRAIPWREGNLVHMHMAADITDLKTMEEELKHAKEDAETANLAKNEFLANMSHEIRTPLNGLLGMLQILQLTSLVEEQRDYLNTAFESGRSLLQILNDILDLSKIESGKQELEERRFELGEVLDSVVSVFRHPAESRGLSMSWHIDDSLPRTFIGDKGRLRQILFNLVGNAAKFTETGSVRVEAYPLQHSLEDGRTLIYFSVADTGIGIPDDKVDKVFDPFIQVDGSFTRKYQGTGLGLGIVHRLVSLMQGTIAVDSRVDEGTTIMFTVAAKPSLGRAKTLPANGRMSVSRSLSILVAEDERVNRTVVQRLLGKIGHTATCVENGEAALEILQEQSFDCILMDIQMPGLNGLETTQAIRKTLKQTTPIIALTAHAMKGDRDRFMAVGMNGYVAKPFELKDLKEELERVMTLADAES